MGGGSKMLYCYPTSATKGNWLQACLIIIPRRVHRAILSGDPVPSWSDLVPRKYQKELKVRTGLRDRIATYTTAFDGLLAPDQRAISQAFTNQGRIDRLLDGSTVSQCLDELPEAIREPAKAVGSEAFRLLTEFGIRDEQYKRIYEAVPSKLCPFCGLEHFDAPGEPREDLDHYLPRSIYPFAAANLNNLPPMGNRCNTSYKRAQDPIRNGSNSRLAANPFGISSYSVTLENSDPFGGVRQESPRWQIDFVPATPEADTWDQIFSIRRRYENNHLIPSYESWLEEFRGWCLYSRIFPKTSQELLNVLELYLNFKRFEGLNDRSFLKAAVFEMLLNHCKAGNDRLLKLLMDIVTIN